MDIHSLVSDGFTIPNVRRDFPEWHRGRPSYALWALNVDVPSITRRVHKAQRHLADLLLDDYCRQPHVTLNLCGFPSDSPQHEDDFGTASLRTQLAALRHARPHPFDIEIGALASFTSAPYLTVNDKGGNIAALRTCLVDGDVNEPSGHYTPHVTVGLYADAWPISAVNARLKSFASDGPLRLRITGMSLTSYSAAEIGGPLTPIADYDFDSGTLRWHERLPSCLSDPI